MSSYNLEWDISVRPSVLSVTEAGLQYCPVHVAMHRSWSDSLLDALVCGELGNDAEGFEVVVKEGVETVRENVIYTSMHTCKIGE